MPRIVKNPDERREEIVKTARELFLTNDYDKTTMKDLMDRLNIAKGTIYHYFASKKEILEAVVEDIVDEELRKKETLLNSPEVKNLNALEKLKVLIIEDEIADENEKILDTLHSNENLEMHARQLGRYIVKLAPLWADIFKQGTKEGIFNVKNPLECAEFILSGFQFITDIGFYSWTEKQLARRTAAMPGLIEAVLGAPEGSFGFLNEL